MKNPKFLNVMSTVLLVIALAVSFFLLRPITAEAATVDSGTCGDNLTWTLDDEGTLTISGTGTMRNWKYWPILCAPWYNYRSFVKSVVIGDSVTSIGNSAFYNCSKLQSVTIPDSVTSIGYEAFYNCKALTSVTIPDSITWIGDSAFYDCEALTSVTIPDSITSIGSSAFSGCSKLTYNTYDNAKYLGNANNPYLALISTTGTSITVCQIHPDTRMIADKAFYDCFKLQSVTIGDSVESIGDDAFSSCDALTSIIIPDSVTSIGFYAFYNCSKLQSVTIPDSVTSIGSSAFSGCSNLTYNTYDNAKYLGNGNNPYLALISATGEDITACQIHPDTRVIAACAFHGCEALTSVTIPDGVTRIGSQAFDYCSSLTSATIGDSVESIGYHAFSYCDALESVTIGNSVTSIGFAAFYDCSKLQSVYITDIVAWCKISFGDYDANPLYYADNLYVNNTLVTNLDIPDGVTRIGSYAFNGCDALTSVNIGNGVTSIGKYAFYSCDALKSVTIGNGVTSIGERAFSGCNALTDVYITDSNAWCKISFDGSYSNPIYRADCLHILDENGNEVTELVLDNTVTTIPNYAFRNSAITAVTIPDSVTSIGGSAFYNCDALKSVTIGNSVTSIGSSAFYWCDALTNVYYAGSQSQWYAISIGSYNNDLIFATIHYNHVHDYTLLPATTVAPTCTEDGYTEYTCVWGETYREKILPALGHDYSGVVTTVEPTCTEEGYTTSTCLRCNQTVTTDHVAALGHDYSGAVTTVEPTCTQQGYTSTKCIRCDSTEEVNYTNVLGHKMVLLPASDPTCEKPGLTAGTGCERCGIVGVAQKETAPALGHSMVAHKAKAPSCTEVGWEAYEACENCDRSTYREIPMLDHDFADGVCTVCGKLERKPGDIDGNDVVDRNDVIQLLLHVTMPGRFPIDCDADFNGDGAVNRDDVIKLLLHVTMPNRFPLEVRKKD